MDYHRECKQQLREAAEYREQWLKKRSIFEAFQIFCQEEINKEDETERRDEKTKAGPEDPKLRLCLDPFIVPVPADND